MTSPRDTSPTHMMSTDQFGRLHVWELDSESPLSPPRRLFSVLGPAHALLSLLEIDEDPELNGVELFARHELVDKLGEIVLSEPLERKAVLPSSATTIDAAQELISEALPDGTIITSSELQSALQAHSTQDRDDIPMGFYL